MAGSDDPVTTDEPMREQFKLKTLQFDVSMGGSRDGDQQRESDEQARRFAEIARRRHAAASRDQTPERDDLMAAVRGAPSIDALAPLLRSAVVPERKRLAQFFIDVARVWRSSRPVDPVSAPLSLGDVKRALLQPAQPGAPGPAGPAKPQERSAAVNLWLPVFLLNLARPRSPQQQRLAEDRMRMIGRGLSGGAVKAG